MKRVFADTSFFVAAIGRRDAYHERAVDFMREYDGQVATTDFVLVELGDYLFRVRDRRFISPVLQNFRANAQYVIVAATHEFFERGTEYYIAGPDKEWSLTDGISFVVMEEHGINDALTTDRDFAQAGFKVLL